MPHPARFGAMVETDRADQKPLKLALAESPVDGESNLVPTAEESLAFNRQQRGAGATVAAANDDAKIEQVRASGTGAQDCPVSPVYNELVDKAWRNVYDPGPLGDLDALKNKYNCQIRNPADAFRFVNQELDKIGDPYNTVLNPTQARALQRLMKGTTRGVGLEVIPVDPAVASAPDKGPLRVLEIMPGSSADKMGVRKGDYIKTVDGIDLSTKSHDDAMRLIQSDKAHKITVNRDGKSLDFSLQTGVLNVPAVVDRMIPNTNYAYIRVRDFMQEDTSYEVQNAVKRYPKADGFVFDVRGNSGGAVDQALQSASLVVDKGTLLTTRTRREKDGPATAAEYDETQYSVDQYEIAARTKNADGSVSVEKTLRVPDLINKPTVILVDGQTASAAEIFAAAVQQNGEGTIVGTQTYGKGIGQTIFFEQPAGSNLQVTNFRFFTPNGSWIGDARNNRIGVKPDQTVSNLMYTEPESAKDQQFKAAIATINKKLGR